MSSAKIDGVYRTRTPGVAARGVPDQYTDGKAAKVWKQYIGQKKKRTEYYRDHVLEVLKEHNCKTILDVATGTGYVYFLIVFRLLRKRNLRCN